ncbi:MAG TPA: PKD domain-containing protein [Thermoanaerobaculia bacterium]|nr:PKD domain-containing protein [Thermoanaerobaculia bacterium]
MKSPIPAVYWLTCVLMLAIAAAASATTIVMPSDEQLIQKSPVIVRGMVVSSEPVERGGAIWTETVLQIDETLKGNVGATVTIREIGGMIGNRITKIFGAPEYATGEHVLAFLTPTPRGDYQTIDLFVGKFSERSVKGQRLWRRDADETNVTLVDAQFQPIESANVDRDAARFEQFVVDRVSGREGSKNYGSPSSGASRHLLPRGEGPETNFTLISEPTVYRWFAFDNGGSAAWYSYGTQPGYSGGGVSEATTAMSAWTTYTAANIKYRYAGTSGGTPAGLARANGTNEILFNDPLNEIAGSWSPSTGGVVGQGGFNGVSSASSWNGPFNADATHTQQTYRAWNITEGNLVIQDNVSPSAHISSNSLAEIIAHEFGHTLGFGHSADSTALMYATVTGIGPSLRADDQLAARWLYSSGNSTPPLQAPAAPSNLTATASSSSSVALQWNDNSSNESGFSIYYAGSGSFTKAGQAAAGQTSATISGLSAGTYRFYVAAFNAAGESGASNTVTVTLAAQPAPIAAAFSVSPGTTGTAGSTTFMFTDQSTGTVASRTWNFGDGATSTSAAPTHVYSSAGQYTVVLTVRDSAGTQSQASRVISVSAALQPLNAAFTYSPSSPLAGDLVNFIDQSTGGVTSWLWNFGDGSVSSDQNPMKQYATAGLYTVTLTIYRNGENRVASHNVNVGAKIPATPQPGQFKSLIPVTAQTNGIGGSIWRTELTIFNAGDETASVDLLFVPGAGVAPQTRSIFVLPRETRTYANALLEIFGMPSGAGGINITATAATTTPDLKVTSRTFNAAPTGTYGQAVPDVDSTDLQSALYMTGLISTADFRTNIGLVNKSGSSVATTMTLLDADGNVVQSTTLTVPPNSFQQGSLGGYFTATAGRSDSLLSLRIGNSARDAVSVYASVVDNRTQDPVYIQAMPIATSSLLTIPVVARANGANGTFWRSDVTLFNPSSTSLNLMMRFGVRTRSIFVGPNRSVVIPDVVTALGEQSGSGPLEISWSGSSAPVVTSRTYTTVDNGGTYGQSVDVVEAFATQQYVTGLRSDADFRTNVGFLNGGNDPIIVQATVLSASGAPIGSVAVNVAAHSLVQYPLMALTPGVDAYSIGSCTLDARTNGAAALFLYGSVVDNRTGDPVFFGGK